MQIIEIPGFLRESDSLLEEADIHWGEKEGGKERSVGGRDRGRVEEKKKGIKILSKSKYFIDVLKYWGVLRCSVTF